MIELEIDGRKVEVSEGSMLMHAADRAGSYVPHFCYHKKLSIAANCRMCLVEVEKAPKPMPACATPATEGMVVRTRSDKALKAQRSVMEFLLINHPLDCPICDQGGECQLQDIAVGYGGSSSRYHEDKRVVFHKNVGPLISMEGMTRCIHCTRCIRFGQEVAGVMELGMIHRGEHAEITTVAGKTIDSELSGNMIDVCPVGALLSKPFLFKARTWELSRKKSVSPHDSTGANLVVQTKGARVMRVVPFENEAVNECWIADRDRFSYEALASDDRLTRPMVKQGGAWHEVDWTTALDVVARGLADVRSQHGPAAIGALGSPHSTVEELHLLARLARGLGSDNVDHRLRQAAPAAAGSTGVRWLGMPIARLTLLDRALVVGSFLRKDHPLFAQRLRQAAKSGGRVHSVQAHAVADDDWLMPMSTGLVAAPSRWVAALADIAAALAVLNAVEPPVRIAGEASADAQAIAASMKSGEARAVLLGNAATEHPDADQLLALATWIGGQAGASVGVFGAAANSVGAQLVHAQPQSPTGLDARRMLEPGALRACVLLNVEPALDLADGPASVAALQSMAMVVALTPFKSAAIGSADVLLPIATYAETSGTFVNAEGRVQSFHGAVKPHGEARPAWKVLRVLGNLLGLAGFDFETSEDVRTEALGPIDSVAPRLDNRPSVAIDSSTMAPAAAAGHGAFAAERIADVPIYATDALVRRAPALQATADARPPEVRLSAAGWARLGLGLSDHPLVRVEPSQPTATAAGVVLAARLDASLAADVVRIATAHPATAALGSAWGAVSVTRVEGARVAPDASIDDADPSQLGMRHGDGQAADRHPA